MKVTDEMVAAAKAVLRDCERQATPVDEAVRKMLEAAQDAWWDAISTSAVGTIGKSVRTPLG